MNLKNKRVVVTGGSRGLGLGLVEALVDEGAKVWVVARDAGGLEKVRIRLGVKTVSADITDASAANSILSDVRPEALILNAGAVPRMARFDQSSWEEFTGDLGHGRQRWPLLDAGGVESSACPQQPSVGELERRGPTGFADVGWLRRRKTDAVADGQVR
jgi:hypothetical protein